MSKKKTAQAEVLDKEDPKVDLSKTTQLVFGLTKADVIDYYMGEEEETLEKAIKTEIQNLKDLDKKIEKAKSNYDNGLKVSALKNHKRVISAAKKAITNLRAIGSDGNQGFVEATIVDTSSNPPKPLILGDSLPKFNFIKNPRSCSYPRIFRFQKVPENCADISELANKMGVRNLSRVDPTFNSRVQIHINGVSTGWIVVEWDAKLIILANEYCELKNAYARKFHEIYGLLCRHEELPQLKKRIKKNVIGRVLKNTKDGKLLLEALKGVRKSSEQAFLTGPSK